MCARDSPGTHGGLGENLKPAALRAAAPWRGRRRSATPHTACACIDSSPHPPGGKQAGAAVSAAPAGNPHCYQVRGCYFFLAFLAFFAVPALALPFNSARLAFFQFSGRSARVVSPARHISLS